MFSFSRFPFTGSSPLCQTHSKVMQFNYVLLIVLQFFWNFFFVCRFDKRNEYFGVFCHPQFNFRQKSHQQQQAAAATRGKVNDFPCILAGPSFYVLSCNNRHGNWLAGWLTDSVLDPLADWLIDELANWATGKLQKHSLMCLHEKSIRCETSKRLLRSPKK